MTGLPTSLTYLCATPPGCFHTSDTLAFSTPQHQHCSATWGTATLGILAQRMAFSWCLLLPLASRVSLRSGTWGGTIWWMAQGDFGWRTGLWAKRITGVPRSHRKGEAGLPPTAIGRQCKCHSIWKMAFDLSARFPLQRTAKEGRNKN